MAQIFTVLIICFTVAFLAFIILLSLPKSRLRSILLEFFGWATATASAASIISPIDPIPDFIPVLGQLDDVGMLVTGLVAAGFAMAQRAKRETPKPLTSAN